MGSCRHRGSMPRRCGPPATRRADTNRTCRGGSPCRAPQRRSGRRAPRPRRAARAPTPSRRRSTVRRRVGLAAEPVARCLGVRNHARCRTIACANARLVPLRSSTAPIGRTDRGQKVAGPAAELASHRARPSSAGTRAARPRHPACAAATAPVRGSASSSGTQSAAWTATASVRSRRHDDVGRPAARPGASPRRRPPRRAPDAAAAIDRRSTPSASRHFGPAVRPRTPAFRVPSVQSPRREDVRRVRQQRLADERRQPSAGRLHPSNGPVG